jgi:uncharacterized membrane protein
MALAVVAVVAVVAAVELRLLDWQYIGVVAVVACRDDRTGGGGKHRRL